MDSIENRLIETLNIKEIPAFSAAAKLAISKTLIQEKSAEELSNIIKENPSLALKILKVANSSLYSRKNLITNIKDAIIFLGYKTVKSIILSITIRDIFSDRKSKWFDYKAFWLHSIAVAILSEEFTKKLHLSFEDDAYAIGLLHDIGKAILFISDKDKYRDVIEKIENRSLMFREAENEVFGFDHTDAARFLFEYWELPKELILPTCEYHKENHNLEEIKGTRIAIVKVANEMAHITGYGTHPKEPPYTASEDVIERVGLLHTDMDIILDNLKKKIVALSNALNIQKTDIKGYFEVLSAANRELGRMYLENQKMVKKLIEKENLLARLHNLSSTFLNEKNIEEVLRTSCESFLQHFDSDSISIEFYLNEEKSILYNVFRPNIFPDRDMSIKTQDFEESKQIVQRGTFQPQNGATVYSIDTGFNEELGKVFIETEKLIDRTDIKSFVYQLALGLNNLKLFLTNRIKTENSNIAIKKLKEEIERRKKISQLNELILENSPVGILSIDENYKIVQYNRKAEGIFGESLKDKNLLNLDIFVQNDLQIIIENLVQKNKSADLTVKRDDVQYHLHIEAAPVKSTSQTLILVYDITERKENERNVIQKEKMATLGELAAGIAHNLRSPLAFVKGIPELILSDLKGEDLKITKKVNGKEVEDKELKSKIELISKSMVQSLPIIDSIMEFSKKEIGSFEQLNLQGIIDEALLLLEHRLKEKDIKILNNTKAHTIFGNKNMLIQIFVNLLNNSIDAIKAKGTIEVSCNREKDKMIIHFEDNGVGIEYKNLERVFEPFFTNSDKANVTGMGLTITRKMITIHGGTIKAIPKRGRGTIMELIFPTKEAE